ncbi:MAG: hypothetical protein H7Y33_11830 [Cytophagales bacterium]|nr:hypothetical protein [Rhizobacter sp.]
MPKLEMLTYGVLTRLVSRCLTTKPATCHAKDDTTLVIGEADHYARPIKAGSFMVVAEPEAPAPQDASTGIALEHWDLLFRAVTERLSLTANTLDTTLAPDPGRRGGPEQTRASIQECLVALDQLRTTVRVDLDQQQRLGLQIFQQAHVPRRQFVGSHGKPLGEALP